MASTRNSNTYKSLVDSQGGLFDEDVHPLDRAVAMIQDHNNHRSCRFSSHRFTDKEPERKRHRYLTSQQQQQQQKQQKLLRKEKDAFLDDDDDDYRSGSAIASASRPLMMRAAPFSRSKFKATSTRTRTNSIRTKKATDTTGTSSSLLGTTTRAVTPLTSSRNSRTREALCQSDSRNFAKALAGGDDVDDDDDDDNDDKNKFLSKRSMILNQGLKSMKKKGGSGSGCGCGGVNGDGVDNDIPQRRTSSIVSRVRKAENRPKPNRDIARFLQESPRNTSDNIQYGGTNNWNPPNGSRCSNQQNTRSSSTHVNSTGGRATYGTLSSSLSQKSTSRTRSARRKANRDITSLLQESPRNTGPSRRDSTAPEIIDITNSDSDNDDDKVVEDSQIIEFTLKRLAINYRVRNQQDHQPMIKYDLESNAMILSFNKSKVDVTKGRTEIFIGMGDVQGTFHFGMNDTTMQDYIDLDLNSFIYLRAEVERPGARDRKQAFHFELEFEEDGHLLELLKAVEESGLFVPSQTQPRDIEYNAKALTKDSRRKYKLRSQATAQTTQSINKDSTPMVMDTTSVSTSNTMSQKSSISGSPPERAKIVQGQSIENSNDPKVGSREVLDLREEIKRLKESKKRAKKENKRLKESEKMAKEEFKRAQEILLQAGAIIVDEINDGDNHPKEGTKPTTRSLLVAQELRNKNEGLEGQLKNFEEGIDKAKKVLEQAWAIVI